MYPSDMLLLPPRLPSIMEQEDQYIYSQSIRPLYLVRQPSRKWWDVMEEMFIDVPIGTRLLIRRDIRYHMNIGSYIVNDYISMRVAHRTLYGYWTHHYVIYRSTEDSPFPYDINAYEMREDILARHYNNYLSDIHRPLEMSSSELLRPLSVSEAIEQELANVPPS